MSLINGNLRGAFKWSGEGAHAGPLLGGIGLGFNTHMIENSDGTVQICLTDVANAWVRRPGDAIPVWRSLIPNPAGIAGLQRAGRNVFAIACSKTNPNVWAAIYQQYLVITTDGGVTWTVAPGVPKLGTASVYDDPNSQTSYERFRVERMLFDPVDDNVIYFTSAILGKVWRTLDRGATAPQEITDLAGVPTGVPAITLEFDKSAPTVNGRCSRMWCLKGANTIYESSDLGSASAPAFTNTSYPGATARFMLCDSTGRLIVPESDVSTIRFKTAGGAWTSATLPNGATLRCLAQKPGDPTKFFGRDSGNSCYYFTAADFSTMRSWSYPYHAKVRSGRTPVTAYAENAQHSIATLLWTANGCYLNCGWGIIRIDDLASFTDAVKPQYLVWKDETYGIDTLVNKPSRFVKGAGGDNALFITNGDRAVIRHVLFNEGFYAPKLVTPLDQGYGGGVDQALDSKDVLYAAVLQQQGLGYGSYVIKSTDLGHTWSGPFDSGGRWGLNAAVFTDSAGYAIGATSITVAPGGDGMVLPGDFVRFDSELNYYKVVNRINDISGGGVIQIAAPGLVSALTAAPHAVKSGGAAPGVVMAANVGTLIQLRNAGGWPQITFDDRATWTNMRVFNSYADAVAETNEVVRTSTAGNLSAGWNLNSIHNRSKFMARDPRTPGRVFIAGLGNGSTSTALTNGIYETIPGTDKMFRVFSGTLPGSSFTIATGGFGGQLAYDWTTDTLYYILGSLSADLFEDATAGMWRFDTNTWTCTAVAGVNEPYGVDVGAPLRAGMPMTLYVAGFFGGASKIGVSLDRGATWITDPGAKTTSPPMGIEASDDVFGLVCVLHGQSGPRVGRWMDVLAA